MVMVRAALSLGWGLEGAPPVKVAVWWKSYLHRTNGAAGRTVQPRIHIGQSVKLSKYRKSDGEGPRWCLNPRICNICRRTEFMGHPRALGFEERL